MSLTKKKIMRNDRYRYGETRMPSSGYFKNVTQNMRILITVYIVQQLTEGAPKWQRFKIIASFSETDENILHVPICMQR